MPTSAGPKNSLKNNLVFALDAADKKNSFLPFSTFLNMSYWSLGPGSATYYGQNGGTDENERVNGTDPWGNSAIVWESRPNGNGNDDGGWNTSWFDIDKTKLYRFSVWVKRTSSTSGGTSYLGLYGSGGTWGVDRLDGGGVEGNPYWQCIGTSAYTQNQWYLLVGHCYPAGTTGIVGNKHPDTGRYTVNGRDGDLNYCNIGGDVRWQSDATIGLHRVYHYYCADNTTRLQWYDPRFEVCDGTEPTIADLLRSPATYGRSLVANVSASLVNGTTWSKANQGTFVLDGTNDYINLGSSLSSINTSTLSIEMVFKSNASTTSFNPIIGWMEDESTHGYICLGNFTGYWSDEVISFYNEGAASTALSFAYTGGPNLQDTNYHHVVFILQTSGYKIYVDGREVTVNSSFRNGSMSTTMPSNLFGYGTTPSVVVGAGSNPAQYANLTIPVVNIYNTTLTPNQVKQNYNQYKSRFNLS